MTPKFLRNSRVREVQRVALANGGVVRQFTNSHNGDYSTRTVEWDISGRCQAPVTVELHGRQELRTQKSAVVGISTSTQPNFVVMEVKCRKCTWCLRQRAAMWRLRTNNEYAESERTWLVTLTLTANDQSRLLYRTVSRLHKAGVKYDALTGAEQFSELDNTAYRDIQLWLKRIRKNTGKQFRYLSITEAHKSGLPHWHLLLHERPGKPLRYDDLKGSWLLGFDSYKLVRDAAGASYLCKYLTKSVLARVRASRSYGGGSAAPQAPSGFS